MKTQIRGLFASSLVLCLLAGPAWAAVHTVSQVGLTFVPEELTINVGDSVEWVWATGLHTVTSGVDLADPELGVRFDEPLDSGQTLVSVTFDEPGEIPYLCRFHFGLGMTGVIRVTTGVTHTIDQVGLTFVPDDLSINVGDTVEWVWAAGNHTVTSGTDLADPDLGVLFDAPLDAADPSFSYTFYSAADVPFLCRPHFSFGMTGIVRVAGPTPVEDVPGRIGFALQQNTPNPFNPMTVIRFTLPESAPVSLRVYDLSGRLVRVVVDGSTLAAGHHQAVWDGRDDTDRIQATGVYIYRLQAASFNDMKTMTLLK